MKVTFFDLENWREIAATLGRNKTRTFLTAFGIFWGTAMLALLWGASRQTWEAYRPARAAFPTGASTKAAHGT